MIETDSIAKIHYLDINSDSKFNISDLVMMQKNPAKVNKDFMIRVRVTEDERNQFWKLAMEKGYKSVSDYIRSLIVEESNHK